MSEKVDFYRGQIDKMSELEARGDMERSVKVGIGGKLQNMRYSDETERGILKDWRDRTKGR